MNDCTRKCSVKFKELRTTNAALKERVKELESAVFVGEVMTAAEVTAHMLTMAGRAEAVEAENAALKEVALADRKLIQELLGKIEAAEARALSAERDRDELDRKEVMYHDVTNRLESEVAALQAQLAGKDEALKNRCGCWGGSKDNPDGHSRPDCHQLAALSSPGKGGRTDVSASGRAEPGVPLHRNPSACLPSASESAPPSPEPTATGPCDLPEGHMGWMNCATHSKSMADGARLLHAAPKAEPSKRPCEGHYNGKGPCFECGWPR